MRLLSGIWTNSQSGATIEIFKDVAGEYPGHTVYRRRGRQVARARKDDRETKVLEEIDSEHFL